VTGLASTRRHLACPPSSHPPATLPAHYHRQERLHQLPAIYWLQYAFGRGWDNTSRMCRTPPPPHAAFLHLPSHPPCDVIRCLLPPFRGRNWPFTTDWHCLYATPGTARIPAPTTCLLPVALYTPAWRAAAYLTGAIYLPHTTLPGFRLRYCRALRMPQATRLRALQLLPLRTTAVAPSYSAMVALTPLQNTPPAPNTATHMVNSLLPWPARTHTPQQILFRHPAGHCAILR